MIASRKVFRGTCTALITPFKTDHSIDVEAAKSLVKRQLDAGIDAVAVLGATGEDSSLRRNERRRLAELVSEEVNGKVPVIVGAGSASTSESVKLTKIAASSGADCVMVVTPYYCRPTADGVRAHLSEVASATDLPIIFYHVPFRTGVTVPPDAMLRIAEEIQQLRGIKECTGSLSFVAELLTGLPDHVDIYSGDEEATLHILQLGGIGIISAFANVAPLAMKKLVDSALQGNWEDATKRHFALLPAFRDCFSVSNPLPAKAAMSVGELCGPTVRLPLLPIGESDYRANHGALARVLEAHQP